MGWEYRIFFRPFCPEGSAATGGGAETFGGGGVSAQPSVVDEWNKIHNSVSRWNQEPSRTDLYVPYSPDVGIKYRNVDAVRAPVAPSSRAALEVKCRIDRDELGFERWKKHLIVENIMNSTSDKQHHDSITDNTGLSMLLKRYSLAEIRPEVYQENISIHKRRKWGETKNSYVFVEETELLVSRRDKRTRAQTTGAPLQTETAKDEQVVWTTISIENHLSSKECLAVRDAIRDLARSYAMDGILMECSYAEFVAHVAKHTTETNAGVV